MPPVLFRDVEELLVTWLKPALIAESMPGPVVTIVPDPRPDLFTVVTRTGGPSRNKVTDGATVTVDCWAADMGTAMDRAQMARGLLLDLPGTSIDGTPVYRAADVGGPSQFPDPETGHPRVRFTVEVWLRGVT